MNYYQDFIIRFPTHTIVIEGKFSRALASGLLQGLYNSIFAFIHHSKGNLALLETEISFQTGPHEIADEDAYSNEDLDDLDELTRDNILNTVGSEVYVLLIYGTEGEEDINIDSYTFNTRQELADFLRGFMTMLSAFNISIQEAITTAPFRGNVDYTINNIRLPRLQ